MFKMILKCYAGLILATTIFTLFATHPTIMLAIGGLVLAIKIRTGCEPEDSAASRWKSSATDPVPTPADETPAETTPPSEKSIDVCITQFRSAKLFELAAKLERVKETKSQLDRALDRCFENGGYTYTRYADLANDVLDGIVESADHALKFDSLVTDKAVFADFPCVKELEVQIDAGCTSLAYALEEIVNVDANTNGTRKAVTRSAKELSDLAKRANRLVVRT